MTDSEEQPQREFDGRTVMVVDDDQVTRHVTVHMLKVLSPSIQIMEANDGVESLELLSQQVPDIIILDLIMPRMDGYALLKQLRSDGSTNMVPVAVLTAFGDEWRKRDVTLLGCDAFLHKPVKSVELIAIMHSLLRMRRLYERLKKETDSAESRYRTLVRLLEKELGAERTNSLLRKNAILASRTSISS